MVVPTRPPEGAVLVVDDEDTVRRIATRILTEAGFRVLEARDAAEALGQLAQLGSQGVWLVVSDIVMPGMTGEELAEVIAQKWPTVQVLLISGQGRPWGRFTGSFLQKPFSSEALLAAVNGILASQKAAVG